MLENTKLEEPTAIARHDVSEWDGLRGAGPDNGPPEPQNIDWERINSLIAGTKHEIPKLTSDVLSGMGRLDSCGLEMYEKANIFGVFAGIKPAALIDISGEDEDYLGEILDSMGLYIKEYKDGIYGVSRHEEVVCALGHSWKRSIENGGVINSDDATEYKMGKLLGYPATSTGYFLHRLRVERETGILPDSVRPNIKGDERLFAQFVLSPGSYQLEIDQYSKPLSEAVRLMAPNTYRDILERDARRAHEASIVYRSRKIGSNILHRILGLLTDNRS